MGGKLITEKSSTSALIAVTDEAKPKVASVSVLLTAKSKRSATPNTTSSTITLTVNVSASQRMR
jgi:hypothetical protein